MDRVLVIGCPGAGKSTFSRKLAAVTGLPLHYLDMIWHKPDRTNVSTEEFDRRLNETMRSPRWIIDGNYLRTLPLRLGHCDTVFFLDYPTDVCMAGALDRIGRPRPDMPWTETEPDEEFLAWIRGFHTEQRPQIIDLLASFSGQVIRFRTRSEADAFIDGLTDRAQTVARMSERLNRQQITGMAAAATADTGLRENLRSLIHSADRRTAANALWVLTCLPQSAAAWLDSCRDELTDMLLAEDDASKKRMLLQLLRSLAYTPVNMRTDLLDYCLSKINSESEMPGVRALCIHIAYKMCRHYPELIAELEEHLALLSQQPLSPGLRSARQNTLAAISRPASRKLR